MQTIERPDKHGNMIATIAFQLLNSGTALHLTHLSVEGMGSHAAHLALQEYYDAIPDLVDDLVEQYQGMSGKTLSYPSTTTIPILKTSQECHSYLTTLYSLMEEISNNCKHSEILASIDNIKSLLNKVRYKLKFLK